MTMLSPGVNDWTMNGPAPTGAVLNEHCRGLWAGSHAFLSAVGDGIMAGSDASAYGKPDHGSDRSNSTVSGSMALMSLMNCMYEVEEVGLAGQAMISWHGGAPGSPERWRFMPKTTASAL